MLTTTRTDRLLVSRQDPATHRYTRVGELRRDDSGYVFEYDDVVERALPGLPLGRRHRSDALFPIFAERVLHPHRTDRSETLRHLGLEAEAEPFEILAVSGGRRTGDTYEITPLPRGGQVTVPFFVHGIRYLGEDERAVIDILKTGQQVDLRPEPDNPFTDRAVLVTSDGARLGWVPDPLLTYVIPMMRGPHEVLVRRVNPVDAGLHQRLLVQISGQWDESSPPLATTGP